MLPKLTDAERKRALRRHLPKTKRAWYAEISGVAAFAIRKPALIDASGKEWFDRITTYYRQRAIVLVEHLPKGISKQEARQAVERVLALYC